MSGISICFITSRRNPGFQWLIESLMVQSGLGDVRELIIIDRYAEVYDSWTLKDLSDRGNQLMSYPRKVAFPLLWYPPKPNVWNGAHRLTPRDWWDAGNSRNTGLCRASGDFIAFLDDRCVLEPTWLDAVREARHCQYAVCGTYKKVTGLGAYMPGTIPPFHFDSVIGEDGRAAVAQGRKMICPGAWVFGCTFALPTEWMLNVNGVDESWGSVSMEDTHFGQMLENNGYPIYHDPRMAMTEDRSGKTEHDMKRSSKEKHPNDKNDKTHRLIEKLWKNKRAAHEWDLRVIRERVLKGGEFPIPTSPTEDWFDGQKLCEMW